MFEELKARGYNVMALQHARAILEQEFSDALTELHEAVMPITIPIEELVAGGGGKTKVVSRLEKRFNATGWSKHNFELTKLVDGVSTQAISHEIDHVKHYRQGTLALEIEWNNKDPFFDRDLQSFRQLHADGAISVGIIITRGESLQNGFRQRMVDFAETRQMTDLNDLQRFYRPTRSQQKDIQKKMSAGTPFPEAWAGNFVASKFGRSTTHWEKLVDRVDRGVGNPCPLVLIGIPLDVIVG